MQAFPCSDVIRTCSTVQVPEAITTGVTTHASHIAQTPASTCSVTRQYVSGESSDRAASVAVTRLTLVTLRCGESIAIETRKTILAVEAARVEDALATLASRSATTTS